MGNFNLIMLDIFFKLLYIRFIHGYINYVTILFFLFFFVLVSCCLENQ